MGGVIGRSVGEVEEGLGGVGGIDVAAVECVGVDLEGGGGVAVNETGGDGNGVDIVDQQDGGMSMA